MAPKAAAAAEEKPAEKKPAEEKKSTVAEKAPVEKKPKAGKKLPKEGGAATGDKKNKTPKKSVETYKMVGRGPIESLAPFVNHEGGEVSVGDAMLIGGGYVQRESIEGLVWRLSVPRFGNEVASVPFNVADVYIIKHHIDVVDHQFL
ncbi:hypothetical protein CsSME_00002942 [Camellia sinensis var. sinensis]